MTQSSIMPFAAFMLLAAVHIAQAEDISPSHLTVARQAIIAIEATEQFDEILPRAAQALKAQLIQNDPNLESIITKTVDEKALSLASRRADLEREAARIYAKAFTEDELKVITTFYTSPTGKKLLSEGPIILREVAQAANIWHNGVARDLTQAVGAVLAKEESTRTSIPAENTIKDIDAPQE